MLQTALSVLGGQRAAAHWVLAGWLKVFGISPAPCADQLRLFAAPACCCGAVASGWLISTGVRLLRAMLAGGYSLISPAQRASGIALVLACG
jgi:hypothetical protein